MRQSKEWVDEFLGHRIYSATAGSNVGHNWLVYDTSSAGAPTYAPVAAARGVTLTLAADSEVENLCLNWGGYLGIDIDDLLEINFRVKMGQAALTTGSMLAFGLQGARNDAIDSITYHASFRVIGADSTTLVVVESDDNVTDKDDVATGKTLINASKDFKISFEKGTGKVQFYIDGQPVAQSTTFDMSGYTGGLQPYFQLQKAANTNVDAAILERVQIKYRGL